MTCVYYPNSGGNVLGPIWDISTLSFCSCNGGQLNNGLGDSLLFFLVHLCLHGAMVLSMVLCHVLTRILVDPAVDH